MRKVWLILSAAILVCAIGSMAFRDDIALFVFRKAIQKQVQANLIAELGDGLHVASCGSGTPLPDRTMAGSCTAVIAGKRMFVFDVGEGATETLALMGLQPARIEAVFLTHYHSDHIAGLGSIALQRNLGDGVVTSLPVYGGEGVEQIVDGFNTAFAQDHRYREEHHAHLAVPAVALKLEARPFAAPQDGQFPIVYDADGVVIKAIAVPHGPVRPALAYRLEYRGIAVVVSGDSMASSNLAQAAKDTDLLVHEALQPDLVAAIERAARGKGLKRLAAVMHDIPGYHATPVEAARTAHRAGAKALAFTHMIPPLPLGMLERPFLREVSKNYAGPVFVMRDGQVLTIRKGAPPAVRPVL
jgi:ribonuclease Z